MQKINIEDISGYRFPSSLNLSPDGTKAVLVIAKANEKKMDMTGIFSSLKTAGSSSSHSQMI